jgi:hypothetical protein
MKTTFEIPDELYRKVKAKSALEGRSVRMVAMELFRNWLGEPPVPNTAEPPSLAERMQRYRGIVDSGVTDLATNPKHLENFGRDSTDHR